MGRWEAGEGGDGERRLDAILAEYCGMRGERGGGGEEEVGGGDARGEGTWMLSWRCITE